jgi:hypothetical protein
MLFLIGKQDICTHYRLENRVRTTDLPRRYRDMEKRRNWGGSPFPSLCVSNPIDILPEQFDTLVDFLLDKI